MNMGMDFRVYPDVDKKVRVAQGALKAMNLNQVKFFFSVFIGAVVEQFYLTSCVLLKSLKTTLLLCIVCISCSQTTVSPYRKSNIRCYF